MVIQKLRKLILGDIPLRISNIEEIQNSHYNSNLRALEEIKLYYKRIEEDSTARSVEVQKYCTENILRNEQRIKFMEDKIEKQVVAINSRIDAQEVSVYLKSLLSAEIMISDLYLENILKEPIRRDKIPHSKSLSVGYCCNMANNHYLFAHILNTHGYEAKLVYQEQFQDNSIFNHPAWEVLDEEFESIPTSKALKDKIEHHEFVISAKWDQNVCIYSPVTLNERALKNFLYQERFNFSDLKKMLLINNILPHWDLIAKLRQFDLLQVSGLAIALAPFTGRPYVTFPYGADIFDSAMEDSTMGRLMRLGFKMASGHILSGTRFGALVHELQMENVIYLPYMCNTRIYYPKDESEFRDELERKYGKGIFLLMPSRQDWEVKGNNKFFEALAKIENKSNIRVFCINWGSDLKRSQELVENLGLSDLVFWLPLLAKGRLRKYINACDVIVDQFNIGEFGTTAIEGMACGKPVICYIDKAFEKFCQNPPVLNCKDKNGIISILNLIINREYNLNSIGSNSLQWVRQNMGIDALLPKYLDFYKKAIEVGPAIWLN